MSEDTKGAIRSPRKGTKGQTEAQEKVQRDKQKPKKRYKGTNNNLQNTMHKSTYEGKTSYHFVTLSRKSKY
jgi:hypothetical protein